MLAVLISVLRDLTDATEKSPQPAGSVSAHSRPVECIAGVANPDGSVTLLTADTMGVLKVWKLEKENGQRPRWRSTLQDTLNHHRTRITELIYGAGCIWTGNDDFEKSHHVI